MTDLATRPVLDLDGTLAADRDLLGGKAWSVNRMRALDLPVPPAFVIPTPVCARFHEAGRRLPDDVWDAVVAGIARLEGATGHVFGAGPSPLLVSVRSGAAQSMPGMMDTVLNLGLTPALVEVLAEQTGDRAWAQDTWHRFREGYATTVCSDPAAAAPEDPWEQLRAAIGAVFDSWTNERVRAYRTRHGLGEGGGTAVTVQAMVFGNRDEQSATGVLFSRDPSTGEPRLYGEWLAQAQGEDVVSGSRTPEPLASLGERWPALGAELAGLAQRLETEHRDLVDVEFTIESGRLYLLQCRAGKRSAQAAVRIAADLAEEGLLAPAEAVARVSAEQAAVVRDARTATGAAGVEPLLRGAAAGPGRATGVAVSDEAEAGALADAGTPFVLVRQSTAPEDVPLMFESVAVVTEVGGSTSHAALVAREIGLPCVVGVGDGAVGLLAGRTVTVDGASGTVWDGELADDDAPSVADPHLARLVALAEQAGEAGAHLRDVARARS